MQGYEISMSKLGYTALSFLIPFGIYKVNQWMHQKGDPSWLKNEQQKNSTEPPKAGRN